MSREALHLEGVRKRLGSFELDIPELTLARGYVLGLIGRNGAGKTTTLNIALNLVHPDAGRVMVLGMEQPGAQMEIKRRVGQLSETPVAYEDVSLRRLARMVGSFYPTWDDGRYHHYVTKFELDDGKRIRQLSRGMKVKAGLVLALSHAPELLLLDEPTSGVDPVVRRELLKEITEVIRDEGRSVVFSSHITQDVEQVADFVAIIDGGRIAEYSEKESLLGRWRRVTGSLRAAPSALEGFAPDGSALEGSSSEVWAQARDLFADARIEGTSFTAVTDRFSDDWLREVGSRGFDATRVQRLGLDEILERVTHREEHTT